MQSTTLEFNTSRLNDFDKKEVINRFEKQLDEVKQGSSSIAFRNFKAFYKRHKWLNGGHLYFDFQDRKLVIHLELHFYYVPVLFVFFSIGLLVIHLERIYLAVMLITILWMLYGFMFMWTFMTFKASIRKTMKEYLRTEY